MILLQQFQQEIFTGDSSGIYQQATSGGDIHGVLQSKNISDTNVAKSMIVIDIRGRLLFGEFNRVMPLKDRNLATSFPKKGQSVTCKHKKHPRAANNDSRPTET